jgi:hypothetical protein
MKESNVIDMTDKRAESNNDFETSINELRETIIKLTLSQDEMIKRNQDYLIKVTGTLDNISKRIESDDNFDKADTKTINDSIIAFDKLKSELDRKLDTTKENIMECSIKNKKTTVDSLKGIMEISKKDSIVEMGEQFKLQKGYIINSVNQILEENKDIICDELFSLKRVTNVKIAILILLNLFSVLMSAIVLYKIF